MPHHSEGLASPVDAVSAAAVAHDYEPPAITSLGTLSELTQGGDDGGVPDGFGDAGFTGSV